MSANDTTPRRPKARTIEVPHPNYPTIKVTAKMPTGVEGIAEAAKLRPLRRVMAIETSSHEVVRHPVTFEAESRVLQDLPADYEAESMFTRLAGWENILDETGNPISFTREQVMVLYEDWLDVYRDATDEERAQGTERVRISTYANYIVSEVRKEQAKVPSVAAPSASQ